MKVINLYGGPGTGKSTTATGLFHLMKLKGYKVEYVSEYAKDLVWDKSYEVMNDQLLIFANQYHRIKRLEKHGVEYVVTDSPLLLSLHYKPEDYYGAFTDLVWDIYDSLNNIDVFLTRVKPYCPIGRRQNEETAISVDARINKLLTNNGVIVQYINADEHAPANILKLIDDKLTNIGYTMLNEVKPAAKETTVHKVKE